MKKLVCVMFAMLLAVSGFAGVTAAAEVLPAEDSPVLIYEAFFLNNEEIQALFSEVRGSEAPYGIVTQDFHVTTVFMPETDMREFYGTEVTLHIYAYQKGEILIEDGSTTANEGFFCTVTTENAELQDFIDHLEKNWHITGAYKDEGGAKYTGYLDLTDALSVEYTVTGRFGGYMSDGSICFSSEGE